MRARLLCASLLNPESARKNTSPFLHFMPSFVFLSLFSASFVLLLCCHSLLCPLFVHFCFSTIHTKVKIKLLVFPFSFFPLYRSTWALCHEAFSSSQMNEKEKLFWWISPPTRPLHGPAGSGYMTFHLWFYRISRDIQSTTILGQECFSQKSVPLGK